jgi:hypothetical protein
MSVRILRNNIRAWIERFISIQSWDLDVPPNVARVMAVSGQDRRFPANCAIELPVRDLIIRKGVGEIEAEALLQYLILYRFSGNMAKHQLPMGAVELVVNYLCERAARYPGEIWEDIIGIDTEMVNDVAGLGRVEGEDGDWLIIAKPEFRIKFISRAQEDIETNGVLQPPIGVIDPPVEFSSLTIKVNRSDSPVNLEPNTYILDRLLEIP